MTTTDWYAYVLVSFGATRAALHTRGMLLPVAYRSYVGVAIDVGRRLRQHNGELAGGARATRVGRPWQIAVVHGPYRDRGAAQSVEYQLKRRRGVRARVQPVVVCKEALFEAENRR